MNIGIFGGTFNPPHNGHLVIAQYAIEGCGLDKVYFMTSATPPHKSTEMTPSDVRHRLVELATAPYENLYPFDFELRRDGPSYTAHTMCMLSQKYCDDKLFFIMGADSPRDFHLWREPAIIAKHCTIIVYPRYGVDVDLAKRTAEENYGAEVIKLDAPIMDISSTEIRCRINNGLPADFFLPESVGHEIKKEKLYV